LFTNRQGPLPTALESTARLPTARRFAVWRRFYALLTTAVDAVDTLRVLARWFVLLGKELLCVSFCRDNIHAPAQRLHLPLQVCRRELLATAHAEAESVATTAPAGTSLTHLTWNYWITARPLLVSRTSSPMTVMFSSRPTIRLVLPGIAPPDL
jgi:hypothetical protein